MKRDVCFDKIINLLNEEIVEEVDFDRKESLKDFKKLLIRSQDKIIENCKEESCKFKSIGGKFINEKCKYLCPVEDNGICSYGCLKNHFNIHNTKGCLACEDFECKHFEKVE